MNFPNANEIRARAGQLKDYIAQRRNIPLDQDFEITMGDLDDVIDSYIDVVGDTGYMDELFKAIKDKDKLLWLMNNKPLSVAPIALPIGWNWLTNKKDSEDKDKKAFGGEIKDFRDNRDNSVQMGAYGGTINGDNKEKKKTYIPKDIYDIREILGWEHGVEKEPLIRHIKNVNGMEGEDAENFIKENYIEIEEEDNSMKALTKVPALLPFLMGEDFINYIKDPELPEDYEYQKIPNPFRKEEEDKDKKVYDGNIEPDKENE
jgi:hypothetical protein